MYKPLSAFRKWSIVSLALIAWIPYGYALAQTKVVVIPMSGDDLKPLQNVISVAKKNGDFTDPLAALNSITNASANNPYLVVVAPGVYDLGNATLTLKPFVSLQGSGKDITIIRAQAAVEDDTAVRLLGDSMLGHLTIIQDANPATIGEVYGVVAEGDNFRLESCKIDTRNPSFRAVGFALDDAQGVRLNGVLEDVEFLVSGAQDRGLGRFASSTLVAESVLVVRDSHFKVQSSGTAISRLGLSITGSKLLVSDTVIELLSNGIGVGNTDGEDDVYRNIAIVSDAANARALSGAGSNFRPMIENSYIRLTGTGSIAVTTNNGRPAILNSYVEAPTVFSRSSSNVFTPIYNVDNSVLRGSRIVQHNVAGGNIIIRFGATKLDAFTPFDAGSGTIDASCANSYDRNYDSLSEDCT